MLEPLLMNIRSALLFASIGLYTAAAVGELLASEDPDASAFASEVAAEGGTIADAAFTSDLISGLKAIPLQAGGNAYSQLYAGFYPGAYKLWGSDPDRLDKVFDLSRNGRHFYSNNSDSKRPFLAASQLAGQPVSRHDATKGWLRTYWTPPAQPHAAFALFKPTGGTSSLDFVLSDTIRARRSGSSSVWVDGYGYASVPAAASEWSRFAVRCEHALGSHGWKVWGNGSAIRNDTPYGSGAGSGDLRIGGNFDEGAPADIGLVLYYAVSLTDAEIAAIDSAIQTIYDDDLGSNQGPSVNAGADLSITLPVDTVPLDGTVGDDGLPSGGTLTTAWTKQSGPGTVTFGDASTVDTTVVFAADGTYVLRLTGDDGNLQSFDEVTITVDPAPGLPSVPTGLTLNGATGTSLDASCNTVSGATGYEWQWSTDQSTWTSVSSTTEASTTLTGLPSNSLVYAQVRATNSAGASAWSASASLATQAAWARRFSGTSDQIDWGDIDTFDVVSKLTVSAWIRASDSAANDGAIITDWNSSARDGWAIEFDYNNARLIFSVRNFADGYRYSYTANWSWDAWRHVVCIYDGALAPADRVKIYVDGSAAAVVHVANGGNQYPPASLSGNTQPLMFKNSRDDNTIDLAEVGIWAGVALTDQQMADLYTAGGVATAIGQTPSLYARLGNTVEDETGTHTPAVTGATVVDGPFAGSPPNQPPEGAINVPGSDVTITVGQSVNFAGNGSDPD
ncbi:MAG: PKD domain-containing protein, partial [Opitutaceae bacterium]